MTKIEAGLSTHLSQPVTTLCHCWRLARRDGVVLGFTDHDRTLVIGADRYEPRSGFSASEARQSLGLAADSMDLAGALASDRISDADIEAGLYDGAQVETFLVNWRDPGQHMTIARSVIGRIRRADGAFTAELVSPLQSLDQPAGRFYRRTCDAVLGDRRCRFDVARPGFTAAGHVEAQDGPNAIRAGGLEGYASGWFSHGTVTFPESGSEAIAVVSHRREGASTRLLLDPSGPLAVRMGAAFEIRAGCDKRFETCRGKFANGENFQGFPHLPGNDAAYAYASEGQSFDGRPLVP